MADIDIGPAASDRASNSATGGYTIILKDNVANASGEINSIDIWCYTNLSGVKVGTFYEVSAGVYRCRDSASIGNVTSGSSQNFVVGLDVSTGDLLGFYCVSGAIESGTDGGGIWYVAGDECDTDDEATFTSSANTVYSVYGEGDLGGVVACVTNAATLITDEGATLNGSATGLTESEYGVKRGFKWDTNSGTPYANDWYEEDTYDADCDWSHAITGCDPGVPIYFVAYIVTELAE